MRLNQIIITLFALFCANSVFLQTEDVQDDIFNRNTLSLKTRNYYFFDNASFIQNPFFGAIHGRVEYQRKVNPNNFWSVFIDFYSLHYSKPFNELKAGDFWNRDFIEFGGSYLRPLFEQKKHNLYFQSGIKFRIGSEKLFVNFYQSPTTSFAETTLHRKQLLDLGLMNGFNYIYQVSKRFNFNASVLYTIYPYTFYEKVPSYTWDNGVSRNLITLSLGVGFNFGK